jgi:ABC-2 type transport system ATP-binding protein
MRDPIAVLSKGLRQRVGLAQAILPDPEMLILDEPTSGLDPAQIVEIRNIIRELGKTKTVILSTHILSEVELTCTRAIIVTDGKIVADADLDDLREGSGQGRIYNFWVGREAPGSDQDRAEILRGMTEVESVENLPRSSDDPWRYVVQAKSDQDLRPRLFELAVERKWPLVELHREISTLEKVFIRLTQPGAARDVAAKA